MLRFEVESTWSLELINFEGEFMFGGPTEEKRDGVKSSEGGAATFNGPSSTAQFLHVVARSQRPTNYPERAVVPDEKCPWAVAWPEYAPIKYEHSKLSDPNKKGVDPANIAELTSPFFSHEGAVGLDSSGHPLNPRGRTGISGRGELYKWGANLAADSVITRLSHETGKLEVLLVERKDSGHKALPGGMVDKGEVASETAKRELREETGYELNEHAGHLVYKGYVDDRRNTDNAWMETTVMCWHIREVEAGDQQSLKAGSDAKSTGWYAVDQALLDSLYANHGQFLELALKSLLDDSDEPELLKKAIGNQLEVS